MGHIPKKENMAYFSQNNDEHYKAYYKPKQAPGGTSSISFGDDTPVSTHKKQGANPDCPKTAAQWKRKTRDQTPNEVHTANDKIQVAGKQRHRAKGKAEKPSMKVLQPLNEKKSYHKKTTFSEALRTEIKPPKREKQRIPSGEPTRRKELRPTLVK